MVIRKLRSSDCYPNLAFSNSLVVYRSFLPSWYDKYDRWLHWDAKRERVFCHICVHAVKSKLLFNSKTDPAFITTGFQSWKDALRGFSKHQGSNCHKEAMQKLVSVSDTSGHVDELFSSQIASDRKSNRENLLLILRSIQFLGRQGIPLRGASQEGHSEVDGNFLQLCDVFSEFHPSLREWQESK